MRLQLLVKGMFDFLLSLIMLLLLAPLFLVIALAIKADSKGNVFFIQERVGKDKKLFRIYKFRTMVENAVNMGSGYLTEERDPRITRIGNILRKTSLDELPQLVNILKGEMSFIGPRPTLIYQVEQYDDYQLQRLKMKPGITGWAQVNGRNSISWPARIKLDVYYVNNYSLLLDLKILIKTYKVVFEADKIYGDKENFNIKRND